MKNMHFKSLTFRMLVNIHFQKYNRIHFWKCMLTSIRNIKFIKCMFLVRYLLYDVVAFSRLSVSVDDRKSGRRRTRSGRDKGRLALCFFLSDAARGPPSFSIIPTDREPRTGQPPAKWSQHFSTTYHNIVGPAFASPGQTIATFEIVFLTVCRVEVPPFHTNWPWKYR